MIKVRFHLQHGPHFMQWQFKKKNEIWYFDPKISTIKLYNCFLHNNYNLAKKIHEGENKNVCAWIRCENFELLENNLNFNFAHIKYNPKILPYWHTVDLNNIDNTFYHELFLSKGNVFLKLN
jgi:hypothetical protein